MWIGELITERGIGNGISFIIFAGIVARVPAGLATFLRTPDLGGRHRVRLLAHRRGRGHRVHPGRPATHPDPVRQPRPRPAHVPGWRHVPAAARQPGRRDPDHLRGQHPAVPGPARAPTSANSDRKASSRTSRNFIINLLDQQALLYIVLYFLLTVGFTYFYTAFTFKPDETADQLRKNGGFIPGIRPGAPTRDYLAQGRVPHQPRRRPLPGHRRRQPDHPVRALRGRRRRLASASAARPCSSWSRWSSRR